MDEGGEQGQVALGIRRMRDLYLSEGSVIRSADRIFGPWRYQRIGEAGPWVPLDQPRWLSAVLLHSSVAEVDLPWQR